MLLVDSAVATSNAVSCFNVSGAVDYLGRYSTWEDLTKKTFLMEMDLLKSMENYSTEASLKAKSIGYGQDFWMIGWGSNEALLYMHGNTKKFAESFEKNM